MNALNETALNEAVILGHLVSDPEIQTLDDGSKSAVINIITYKGETDKGAEKKEIIQEHRVVLRGENSMFAEKHLKKGSKVYIKGSMKTRKYIDSSGANKYITEIIALELKALDEGLVNRNTQSKAPKKDDSDQNLTDTDSKDLNSIDDSIPFSV